MNASQLAQRFQQLYGVRPRIYRAPGRVNLIGEHTDYNDGFVMPAAIGFSTCLAIGPRSDRKLSLRSAQFREAFEFELDQLPQQRTGAWCDYVLGVASVLRQHGSQLKGANLFVHGEVPLGAGLSSSAAIEVACALALIDLSDSHLPLPEVARLCREAENTFVGARVGIMDPFISCMGKAGHALLLDCRSLEFQLVPLPADISLVVCNTMVKHDLAAGAYNTRREECEQAVRYFARFDPAIRALRDVSVDLLREHEKDLPANIRKRASHVIHENQRVLEMANALAGGDLRRVGELMRESHASLRDQYEVSCRELDLMVEAAEGLPGFCGGRMTGGGFGGCTVNLVREKSAQHFAAQIAGRYQQKTGIEPQVYLCWVEDGAGEIS